MIKLFRHIHQNLLTEGKTTKYFKYAIGEIILVVIGILIALQINNWNEARKTKHAELKILKELKEDLVETRADLLTDIENAKHILANTDTLYQSVVKNDWEDVKISTNFIYRAPTLYPKLSAYKSLQTYGINIISNDSLRKLVTDFYELHLKRVNYSEQSFTSLRKEIKQHLNAIAMPLDLCKGCTSLAELNTIEVRQKDFYHINQPDTKIQHLLREKYLLTTNLLNIRYADTQKKIETMIALINKEIKYD